MLATKQNKTRDRKKNNNIWLPVCIKTQDEFWREISCKSKQLKTNKQDKHEQQSNENGWDMCIQTSNLIIDVYIYQKD